VTGDVDGDGFGDLVTVTYDGGWLLRSDGEGAFAAPTSLPHARYPSVTGDVDADGRLDVVTMDGDGRDDVGLVTLGAGRLLAAATTSWRSGT
jgi:hypothetical protein